MLELSIGVRIFEVLCEATTAFALVNIAVATWLDYRGRRRK